MLKATEILNEMNTYDLNLDGECEEDDMYDDINVKLGTIISSRCVAHTFQLVATDVSKENAISSFLHVCRALAKHVRSKVNGFYDEFLAQNVPLPVIDCVTRWCSTYKMLCSLIKGFESRILHLIKEGGTKEHPFQIEANFWQKVADYIFLFKSVNEALVKLQREDLHFGDFYTEWLKIKLITTNIIKTTTRSFLKKLAESLLKSITTREQKLLSNSGLLCCLLLDPRYTHLIVEKRSLFERAKSYIFEINDKIERQRPQPGNNMTMSRTSVSISPASQILNDTPPPELDINTLLDKEMRLDNHCETVDSVANDLEVTLSIIKVCVN